MRNYFPVFISLLLISLQLQGCTQTPEKKVKHLEGRVVAITDGDTFTLLTAENRQYKIRLHGIDAPEKKQPFGSRSKQALSDYIFGKEVQVEQIATDRWKRIIGVVYAGDQHINEAMLRDGMAWHYIKYDSNPNWADLESEARREQRGLWSDALAKAPWLWRKK